MVNNSTNINKTNNYLSPNTIEQKKDTTINDVGNPGPGLILRIYECKYRCGIRYYIHNGKLILSRQKLFSTASNLLYTLSLSTTVLSDQAILAILHYNG